MNHFPTYHCTVRLFRPIALHSLYGLLFLLWVNVAFTQNPNSAKSIIEETLGSNALLQYRISQNEELRTEDKGINLVNEVEVRTELTDMTDPQREYTVRIRMNGMDEQDAVRALNAGLLDEFSIKKQAVRFEVLLEIYSDLVEWGNCQRMIPFLEREKIVLLDKMTVLNRKAQFGDAETFAAYFKVESDLEELELDLNECANQADYFKKKYQKDSLGVRRWLSTQALLERIVFSSTLNPAHPTLLRKRSQGKLLLLENRLETARQKQVLDFMQIRYRDPDERGFQEGASFGFGFMLPYNGQTKSKLFELKIKQMEQANEQLEEEEKINAELEAVQTKAKRMLSSYALLEASVQKHQSNSTINKIIGDAQSDPLVRLELLELGLQKEKKLLDAQKDIQELYIEWLEWTGTLMLPNESSWLEE